KVMNQRHNFLQQISTALIKNHDLVVAEELRSKNLLKNRALALSISDVGWRTFLGMLAYKAKLYGRQFITINPRNTTQTCRDCGFVMGTNGTDKLTLDDRNWTCPNCGIHHIRDWNAAKNILDKGIAKLA
ncbi:IS200/IS605 family element transposase accessory protein TnpB, partial [Limosilactobacillus fermentum]